MHFFLKGFQGMFLSFVSIGVRNMQEEIGHVW